MNEFKIDIKTLFDSKLKFDEYLVLYCLHKNDEKLLIKYILECGKLNDKIFGRLDLEGYISIKDHTMIHFKGIELTDKGKALIENSDTGNSAELFESFKKIYPSSVKMGASKRRLHGNLSKCKQLFSKVIKEVPYETLCKCVKMYQMELIKSGSEWYMQSLEVWLNQRNYEQYLDDINTNELSDDSNSNVEVI